MKDGKWKIRWRTAVLGTGVGMITVICLTAAAAGMMAKGVVSMERMGYFAAGILILSGFFGAMTAMIGGGTGMDALLAAVGELVVLVGINGLLCGGKMEGAMVTTLTVGGGCGAAVLLRMGKGSGRRRRRRR